MGGLTTAGQIPPPGKIITVKISQTLSNSQVTTKTNERVNVGPEPAKKNLKKSKKINSK